MATGKGGKKKGKGGKGKGGKGPTVVGPYDRPYLTEKQVAREARIRARESVETPESIAKRYDTEQTGAQAIGETFEEIGRAHV